MAKLRAVECRKFIKVAVDKAKEEGVPITVAVVGPEGHLIALERMDDAGFITPQVAMSKAYTMVAMRAVSPRFPDGPTIQHWFKQRNPQMMVNLAVATGGRVVASGGCAPIFKGNELVGAYAISGATSQQDDRISDFARGAVGWADRPEKDTTKASVKKEINAVYKKLGIRGRKL